jgi:TolA-binding protein
MPGSVDERVRAWAAAEWEAIAPRSDAVALPPIADGDLVVPVLRASDLVSLVTVWHGVEAVDGASGPELRAVGGADAAANAADAADPPTLAVHFPFQHAHESARYEAAGAPQPPMLPSTSAAEPAPDVAVPGGPTRFRPARASRLVFTLPADLAVPLTTAGILALLPSLTMRVHPLATPGEAPVAYPDFPPTIIWPWVIVDTGVRARLRDGVVELAATTKTENARIGKLSRTATRALLAENRATVLDALQTNPLQPARGFTLDRNPNWLRPLFPGGQLFPGVLLDPSILSRPPEAGETAIEAPFRLAVSPAPDGRWTHASHPVRGDDVPERGEPELVELWHTRLARHTAEGGGGDGDAGTAAQSIEDPDDRKRIVRAIWTRDRDGLLDQEWTDPKADQAGGALFDASPADEKPFLGSLNRSDRQRLVRQSSESWAPNRRATPIPPVPVAARRLWLSAYGAALDLHGQWNTKPYSAAGIASILAWDHVATGGRDQYVRVVYPGYLYPLGNRTVLVKVTQRVIRPSDDPVAELVQHRFLAVTQPVTTYDSNEFPFVSIRVSPVITPDLDEGATNGDRFWPTVGGLPFPFHVEGVDKSGKIAHLDMPLMWVAEHASAAGQQAAIDAEYDASPLRSVPARGQRIAFAPPLPRSGPVSPPSGGDPIVETNLLRFRGTAGLGTATPRVSSADVVVTAAKQIAGLDSLTIAYHSAYRTDGFSAANTGKVWAIALTQEHITNVDYVDVVLDGEATLQEVPILSFGDPDHSSESGGGFVQPSQPLAGLSALTGIVGDPDGALTQQFDPSAALAGALPKLFGLIPLEDIIGHDFSSAPAVVSQTMDALQKLADDVDRAQAYAERAVQQAQQYVATLTNAAQSMIDDANATVAAAGTLATDAAALATALPDIVTDAVGADDAAAAAAEKQLRDGLALVATDIRALGAKLPPLIRHQLADVGQALDHAASLTSLIGDIRAAYRALTSGDLAKAELVYRYDWQPEITDWPAGSPIFVLGGPNRGRNLTLSVTGRASGAGHASVEIMAELVDFELHLMPGADMVVVRFDRFSFHSGSSGKTEVDVVFRDIQFVGILSFVQTLKDLIPFDGFSDPPYTDISPSELKAGFTLALPNLAVGIFALANISLGAYVRVPFLGESVSVGFDFCSRERPFTLTVLCIGGGGWFGLRMSPKRLELLELGLEAGAYLSVDLGVASGSISIAIGIYMRLEGDAGSLTGYFRMRGEVNVLGIASASLELSIVLTYEFSTGKMIGSATVTLTIEVFCFSKSVSFHAERRFAGSGGDPSFREMITAPDGSTGAWDEYLDAFAVE